MMKTKGAADYPKHEKRPLADVAYGKIYRKVISLEYEPGESLEEKRIMADLDMGRTPIREALFKLTGEMLLSFEPKKGFVVRPITLQSTRSVFEALEIFELGVTRLAVRHDIHVYLERMKAANRSLAQAVKRADVLEIVQFNHEFHMYFTRSARNDYLVRSLHEVRCEANRLAYLSYGMETGDDNGLKDHYQSVLSQHDRLITLLEKKDESRIRELILEHLSIFKNRIIRYLTT